MTSTNGTDPHFGVGQRVSLTSDQQILYEWSIQHFRMLKNGGSLISPHPAPLSEQQIRTVWERLEEHPDYRDFTFQATTNKGKIITNKEES